MKNKLIKIGISVAIPLSLFMATNAKAATIGTFGADGHFIAAYSGQVNGITPATGGPNSANLRSSTCGTTTAYLSEIINGVSYVIATSSPVTYTGGCWYVDGTTNHYDITIGSFTFLNSGGNYWPYLHEGHDYYVSFSNADPRYGGTATYNTPAPANVDFRLPVASSSINYDFSAFQITATNNDVNPAGVSIEIYYSRNPDFVTNGLVVTDGITHQLAGSTSTIYYIPKTQALYPNSTYYAKVVNLGTNSSSTISWNTGNIIQTLNSNQPTTAPSFQNASTTDQLLPGLSSSELAQYFNVDCSYLYTGATNVNSWINAVSWVASPDVNIMGEAGKAVINFFFPGTYSIATSTSATSTAVGILDLTFCYIKKANFAILGALVIPPPLGQDAFLKDSIVGIKQVFPFNIIFTEVENIKTIAQTSTLQTESINMSLPQIGLSQFNVLSPNTLSNLIGTDLAENIFTIERYIIWLIVGFGVIKIII